MTASRSYRPAADPFRNTLVATAAAHGLGLPVRLKLLALLIAVVITVVSSPFTGTTEDADRGDSRRSVGVGRYGPIMPVIDDAE